MLRREPEHQSLWRGSAYRAWCPDCADETTHTNHIALVDGTAYRWTECHRCGGRRRRRD